jgi:RNA polymerase sigma-70 factor (ECF subfamily)
MKKSKHGGVLSDEQIIDLYFAREERAIAETDKKYCEYLHTVAYNILANEQDAEECLQDTYLRTWDAIPPERPSKLQYFIARITRNIAIDRYRKSTAEKRRESDTALEEFWECIPDQNASVEDELALKQAIDGFLAGLDSRTRVIFMRRYWYSMSVKNIAKGMRLSESHVSVILHRTRCTFREHLIKEGVFE